MLSFSESALVSQLLLFPQRQRAAFAAAAATRQLAQYERFMIGSDDPAATLPRTILTELWLVIRFLDVDIPFWVAKNDKVMSLMPEEDEDEDDDDYWTIWHIFAQDSLATLSYAIQSLIGDGTQEAVWAATQAYETTDQAAIKLLNGQAGISLDEGLIISHPIVQRELARQTRDLKELAEGGEFASDSLRQLTSNEQLFSTDEMAILTALRI